MGNIRKTISYLKRNGLTKTCHMVMQRLKEKQADDKYSETRVSKLATHKELLAQRNYEFSKAVKISILIPAYETPSEFLRVLLDSVLVQSYENFEVIVADASSTQLVETTVAEYDDERIRYIKLKENKGISDNTNEALKLATGDVVCFMDHDDFVEPDALYHIARAFENGAKMVYTDEDKVSGERYFMPNLKTDFNLDLLLCNNYICHLTAIDATLVKECGGFRAEYDGAQDYDLILRCVKHIMDDIEDDESYVLKLQNAIVHVPKVLYHWRVHEQSTAGNPQAKLYAYEAGRNALSDYLRSRKLQGKVLDTEHRGFYRIEYGRVHKGMKPSELRYHIPEGLKAKTKDYESITAGFFNRSEVKAVVYRIIDGQGLIEEEPYKGMKKWDSGLMHRAAMSQNVEEINGQAFCVNEAGNGHLVVYVPYITFERR